MAETAYDYDWVGKVIPVTYGEELKFTDYEGRPATSRKSPRRKDGLRSARLELSTWIGTSAIGAIHHYCRIEATTDWGWTVDDTGEICCIYGAGCRGKPEEMASIDIKMTRLAEKRDVQHFRDTTSLPRSCWRGAMPKIGKTHETGFWTEHEAQAAGIKFFRAHFARGWVLEDQYAEKDESRDLALGEQ